jgi:quercetin dioxygenase-like cupin family protein
MKHDNMLLNKTSQWVRGCFQYIHCKHCIFHNYDHTKETVAAGKEIAVGLQVSDDELETVLLACWFHDLGLLYALENHEKKTNAAVCHKNDRKFWTSNDRKIFFELLNPSVRNNKMEIVFATVKHFETPPEKYTHEGEEFVYVLDGKIEVTVGEHVNKLNTGDSLHFNSGISHHMRNVGSKKAELIVVIYGP